MSSTFHGRSRPLANVSPSSVTGTPIQHLSHVGGKVLYAYMTTVRPTLGRQGRESSRR